MEKFSIFFLLGAIVLIFWFGYLVPRVLNQKPESDQKLTPKQEPTRTYRSGRGQG